MSTPQRIGHRNVHVTVSVGSSVYPADGTDAETLLKHADVALLQAKAHGRNRHQRFESGIAMHTVEGRDQNSNDLPRAPDSLQADA
jgi:predicted signal transduction protein with EAL and GGDEF domain